MRLRFHLFSHVSMLLTIWYEYDDPLYICDTRCRHMITPYNIYYIHIWSVYIYIYIHVYIYIYCRYIYIYIYIYVCVYVCISIDTYIYIDIGQWSPTLAPNIPSVNFQRCCWRFRKTEALAELSIAFNLLEPRPLRRIARALSSCAPSPGRESWICGSNHAINIQNHGKVMIIMGIYGS